MSAASAANATVIRALYRASLRGIRSLEGRGVPVQSPIRHRDWGKFQWLTPHAIEQERQALFRWAPAQDDVLEPETLLATARRRYREAPDDVDAVISEGFSSLRSFYDLAAHLDVCSVAETRGVRVRATSSFLGVHDKKTKLFAYRVRITNVRHPSVVQLRSRHWTITDDVTGDVVTVPRGSPGVVGQTPRLAPGHVFEYVSGTDLQSASGTIRGSFEFCADDGGVFDALVEPFRLRAPHQQADDDDDDDWTTNEGGGRNVRPSSSSPRRR
mmetsp:Transcript_212/g.607  ORF Transcript_212/g.607 Transcript_212/m.607 type:complete len:271 (-) Transcript_212:109-921(-)